MPSVPQEFIDAQYQLRSTFFLGKLQELGFFELFREIELAAQSEELDWQARGAWGVADDAWAAVAAGGLAPVSVFVHPELLGRMPHLLRYYRCLAMLSQKGLKAISHVSSMEDIESGDKALSPASATQLAEAINRTLSALLGLAARVDADTLRAMVFCAAGPTIQGSWNNAIGVEGERALRSLLIKALLEEGDVASIQIDVTTVGVDDLDMEATLANVRAIRRLALSNGATVIFKSEPDVEIRSPDDVTLCAMEIKAGLDPAGALERLGAILKSFGNVKAEFPEALTILVLSCLTAEVESRIRESRAVDMTFILTEVLSDDRKKRRLVTQVRAAGGLIPSP